MESTPSFARRPDEVKWGFFAGLLLLSAAAHFGGLYGLPAFTQKLAANHRIDLEIIELPKPKPPPPPPEPKKEEPPKPKPKVVVKVDTPKPPPPVPPPPNEPPPEPPKAPPPIVVGISLSNTGPGGSFAVAVGNTAYGSMNGQAVDPKEVKPYSAPKYAPPGTTDAEPTLIESSRWKPEYPKEAKENEVEGIVSLRVTIDETGKVIEVQVLKGPGYGLNEAARDAVKRYRFTPATVKGEAVRTTLVFNFTFLLDN